MFFEQITQEKYNLSQSKNSHRENLLPSTMLTLYKLAKGPLVNEPYDKIDANALLASDKALGLSWKNIRDAFHLMEDDPLLLVRACLSFYITLRNYFSCLNKKAYGADDIVEVIRHYQRIASTSHIACSKTQLVKATKIFNDLCAFIPTTTAESGVLKNTVENLTMLKRVNTGALTNTELQIERNRISNDIQRLKGIITALMFRPGGLTSTEHKKRIETISSEIENIMVDIGCEYFSLLECLAHASTIMNYTLINCSLIDSNPKEKISNIDIMDTIEDMKLPTSNTMMQAFSAWALEDKDILDLDSDLDTYHCCIVTAKQLKFLAQLYENDQSPGSFCDIFIYNCQQYLTKKCDLLYFLSTGKNNLQKRLATPPTDPLYHDALRKSLTFFSEKLDYVIQYQYKKLFFLCEQAHTMPLEVVTEREIHHRVVNLHNRLLRSCHLSWQQYSRSFPEAMRDTLGRIISRTKRRPLRKITASFRHLAQRQNAFTP